MGKRLEKLTDKQKEELGKRLDKYLEAFHKKLGYQDEEVELDDLDCCPYRVWEWLEENGWECKRDIDTNGWQLDWWLRFEKENEPKLTLTGSGIYGGLSFSIMQGI